MTRPTKTIPELLARSSYDENVCQAILRFVKFGLEPGSFGTALIRGDYVEAWDRAHSSLRAKSNDGFCPISTMMLWADYLPEMIGRTEKAYWEWFRHGGLQNAPLIKIAKVKILWQPELFGKFPMPENRLDEINEHAKA